MKFSYTYYHGAVPSVIIFQLVKGLSMFWNLKHPNLFSKIPPLKYYDSIIQISF